MVPDRQKVRTDGRKDGRKEWTDGRTHGRRQNYIPPTSSGDKNKGTDKQYVSVFLLHNTTHHYQALYQISES